MKNIDFKIARIKKNLRQIDISFKTGISTSLLSIYENGLKVPPPEHAKQINAVLNEKVFDI
jgi:transcriptional regulator with XRE-family HTH domain